MLNSYVLSAKYQSKTSFCIHFFLQFIIYNYCRVVVPTKWYLQTHITNLIRLTSITLQTVPKNDTKTSYKSCKIKIKQVHSSSLQSPESTQKPATYHNFHAELWVHTSGIRKNMNMHEMADKKLLYKRIFDGE